jgi:hypothetical protein
LSWQVIFFSLWQFISQAPADKPNPDLPRRRKTHKAGFDAGPRSSYPIARKIGPDCPRQISDVRVAGKPAPGSEDRSAGISAADWHYVRRKNQSFLPGNPTTAAFII